MRAEFNSMTSPANRDDRASGAAIAIVLTAIVFCSWWVGWPSSATEAAATAPTTATGGGVTLTSVSAAFPDKARTFPGPEADVLNNNCLACHSAGMVLTQPRLSRPDWKAEVNKMRTTYKAPIAEADVSAIVNALMNLSGQK
jgi:cytochrome c5